LVISNNPEYFKIFLQKAKKYIDKHPNQPKLITINAWNEWEEGSYPEPDYRYGYGYLDEVKMVLNEK
jgi:Glycosyltransferase WbsX